MLLGILLASLAPPTHAATTGAGGVTFQGIAFLPNFPCDPGPCNGWFDGTASGTVEGVHNGTPWTVTFGNANMDADFVYRAGIAACPTTGVANGVFLLAGGTTQATYGTETGSAIARGTFAWDRVGAVANIATNVTFTLSVGSPRRTIVLDSLTDRAVATFVPLSLVQCGAPGPLQAAIEGVDLFPDPLNP